MSNYSVIFLVIATHVKARPSCMAGTVLAVPVLSKWI